MGFIPLQKWWRRRLDLLGFLIRLSPVSINRLDKMLTCDDWLRYIQFQLRMLAFHNEMPVSVVIYD